MVAVATGSVGEDDIELETGTVGESDVGAGAVVDGTAALADDTTEVTDSATEVTPADKESDALDEETGAGEKVSILGEAVVVEVTVAGALDVGSVERDAADDESVVTMAGDKVLLDGDADDEVISVDTEIVNTSLEDADEVKSFDVVVVVKTSVEEALVNGSVVDAIVTGIVDEDVGGTTTTSDGSRLVVISSAEPAIRLPAESKPRIYSSTRFLLDGK